METVNTTLGIIASLLSITAVIWSGVNAYNIKQITRSNSNTKIRGKAKGGDGSVNTVGTGNTIN